MVRFLERGVDIGSIRCRRAEAMLRGVQFHKKNDIFSINKAKADR
jgi:hypothetical protein